MSLGRSAKILAISVALLAAGGSASAAAMSAIAGQAAALSTYVGDYEITPLSHLRVTQERGGLWVQGTGQPKLQVERKSARVFQYKDNPARIIFVADAAGSTIGLILRQGDADSPAPKVGAEEAVENERRARVRIANQLPEPGTEDGLRRYLLCLGKGGPACRGRNPLLSERARLHPELGQAVRALGSIRHVELKGVSRGSGLAIFEVRFEHGLSQWYVGTTATGVVTTAIHIPLPAPPEHSLDRVSLLAQVDLFLQQREQAQRFSGVVLIADGDQILFEKAYGLADRERNVPNVVESRFCVGSIDKMFTAVATMQLIEAGKVRLSDTVSRYLPEYADSQFAQTATVQQLLMHTAGAGDIFDRAYARQLRDAREPGDYVKVLAARPPTFPPGSGWAYSNYGFVLLGRVIEVASGRSYDEVIDRQVLSRASMSRTGRRPEADQDDVAKGYTRGQSGWQRVDDSAPSRRSPAGGSYSTARDLWQFAKALRLHQLVSATGTELLTKGRIGTGAGRYGMGFQEQSIGGVAYFGHAGDAPGVSAELRMIEKSRYVVIVLSNFDPPAAPAVADFITVRLAG